MSDAGKIIQRLEKMWKRGEISRQEYTKLRAQVQRSKEQAYIDIRQQVNSGTQAPSTIQVSSYTPSVQQVRVMPETTPQATMTPVDQTQPSKYRVISRTANGQEVFAGVVPAKSYNVPRESRVEVISNNEGRVTGYQDYGSRQSVYLSKQVSVPRKELSELSELREYKRQEQIKQLEKPIYKIQDPYGKSYNIPQQESISIYKSGGRVVGYQDPLAQVSYATPMGVATSESLIRQKEQERYPEYLKAKRKAVYEAELREDIRIGKRDYLEFGVPFTKWKVSVQSHLNPIKFWSPKSLSEASGDPNIRSKGYYRVAREKYDTYLAQLRAGTYDSPNKLTSILGQTGNIPDILNSPFYSEKKRKEVALRVRQTEERTLGLMAGKEMFIGKNPELFTLSPSIAGGLGYVSAAITSTGAIGTNIVNLGGFVLGTTATGVSVYKYWKAPTQFEKGKTLGEEYALLPYVLPATLSGTYMGAKQFRPEADADVIYSYTERYIAKNRKLVIDKTEYGVNLYIKGRREPLFIEGTGSQIFKQLKGMDRLYKVKVRGQVGGGIATRQFSGKGLSEIKNEREILTLLKLQAENRPDFYQVLYTQRINPKGKRIRFSQEWLEGRPLGTMKKFEVSKVGEAFFKQLGVKEKFGKYEPILPNINIKGKKTKYIFEVERFGKKELFVDSTYRVKSPITDMLKSGKIFVEDFKGKLVAYYKVPQKYVTKGDKYDLEGFGWQMPPKKASDPFKNTKYVVELGNIFGKSRPSSSGFTPLFKSPKGVDTITKGVTSRIFKASKNPLESFNLGKKANIYISKKGIMSSPQLAQKQLTMLRNLPTSDSPIISVMGEAVKQELVSFGFSTSVFPALGLATGGLSITTQRPATATRQFTRTVTSLTTTPIQRPSSTQSLYRPQQITVPKTEVIPVPKPIEIPPIELSNTTVTQQVIQETITTQPTSPLTVPPFNPLPPPPIVGVMPLFGYFPFKMRRKEGVGSKGKKKYRPSLRGLVFRLRAPKGFTTMKLTGFEVRGL